jgi:hypothetical protein
MSLESRRPIVNEHVQRSNGSGAHSAVVPMWHGRETTTLQEATPPQGTVPKDAGFGNSPEAGLTSSIVVAERQGPNEVRPSVSPQKPPENALSVRRRPPSGMSSFSARRPST